MAPYAALSLVIALLGAYIMMNLVGAPLQERFANQMVEAARVASDSVVRRESQHLELVRAVSFTEGVADAISNRSAPDLARLVLPLAANSGGELVEVLDGGGVPLYSIVLSDPATLRYDTIEDGAARDGWPIVASVLAGEEDSRGDKFSAIEQTRQGATLLSAGPVRLSGELIGVIVVGSRLSTFVASVKAEALADITLHDVDGTILATTFAATASGTLPEALVAAAGATAPLSGSRERISVFEREYELLYTALRLRGEPVGWFSVASPTSFIAVASNTTRWQLALFFTSATLVVLGTGWLLARLLTVPLLRLVRAAQAVSAGDLTARSQLRTGDEIGQLSLAFDEMTGRLQRQHMDTLEALVSAIDARDRYTRGHSLRVGLIAAELGAELRMSALDVQHLHTGGYLHDIGKIGVRDAVLLKPGRLSDEEWRMMRQHPSIGLEILHPVEMPAEVRACVGSHHERMDGSGYPLGLSGAAVPLHARVVTVADIWDALVTDRPYRAAMSAEEAFEILHREALEGLIDADIVTAMREVAPRWKQRRREEVLEGAELGTGEHARDLMEHSGTRDAA